jgi:hypothetical protein
MRSEHSEGHPAGTGSARCRRTRRGRTTPLTALWPHVYDIERLREADDGVTREVAPGLDGQTWTAYGEHREANLRELADRLQRGADHAAPGERVYLP